MKQEKESNDRQKVKLIKIGKENANKDKVIELLKKKLKQEKITINLQKTKLIEVEQEHANKERVIESLRDKIQQEKRELEIKSKLLECDKCPFGGMNLNDLNKHKLTKHKIFSSTMLM